MARKKVGTSEDVVIQEEAVDLTFPPEETSDNEFAELEQIFEEAYNGNVTIDEAERLAAKFLLAQMRVARELAVVDLDAKAKKAGVKASKAAAYMAEVKRNDKKPAEGLLEHVVNLDQQVCAAVDLFDKAEARKESLSLYFSIFKEAHVYFRGVSKGRYD